MSQSDEQSKWRLDQTRWFRSALFLRKNPLVYRLYNIFYACALQKLWLAGRTKKNTLIWSHSVYLGTYSLHHNNPYEDVTPGSKLQLWLYSWKLDTILFLIVSTTILSRIFLWQYYSLDPLPQFRHLVIIFYKAFKLQETSDADFSHWLKKCEVNNNNLSDTALLTRHNWNTIKLNFQCFWVLALFAGMTAHKSVWLLLFLWFWQQGGSSSEL